MAIHPWVTPDENDIIVTKEVHRVLTTKVFPRQAEVKMIDEWA